ncbi:MAG: PRC-barrel domain-containing protein [Alphaproteobacteria bacterium]|nr:PRC-barrel domain-containing protein [Alphaproteobacteria bacterium]
MTYTYNKPLLSAASIDGDKVKNAKGEDLGNIKDLMINTATGEIQYAVLSFGGFMGMGDKFFAVPWEAFAVDWEDECLTLNVEKDVLKSAPGFDKDNWPNMADLKFQDQISGHYGIGARRAA